MKQRIFSLLVLMLVAVSGAWADTTSPLSYKLVFSSPNAEGTYTFDDFTIPENSAGEFGMLRVLNAVTTVYDLYSSGVTVVSLNGNITKVSSNTAAGVTSNGNGITLGPITEADKLTGTLVFSVPVECQKGDDVSNHDYTLQIDVYHNKHSYTGNTWEKDDTYHWHVCNNANGQCDNSDAAKAVDKAEHTIENGKCTVCESATGTGGGTGDDPTPDNSMKFQVKLWKKYLNASVSQKVYDNVDITLANSNVTSQGFVISEADILDVIKRAYQNANVNVGDNVSFAGNISKETTGGSITLKNNTNHSIVIGPFVEGDDLTGTVNFSVPFSWGGGEANADFKIDVYHLDHSYTGNTWQSDGNYHWHLCNNKYGQCTGGDDAKLDKAEHSYVNGVCTCGQQDPNGTPVHEHSFPSQEWEQTETHHYKKCTAEGCDLDYDNLSDDDKILVAYGEHQYSTNVGSVNYYKCLTCGYENESRKEPHTCAYGGWNYNTTEHWKSCNVKEGYCPAPKKDEGEHSFGDDIHSPSYYKCVCGYKNSEKELAYLQANHKHVLSSAWSFTDDTEQAVGVHYHQCISKIAGCQLDYDHLDELTDEQKAEISYGNHTYGTSQEGVGYYQCKVCKHISDLRKGETHDHNYVWKKNNTQHWEECTSEEGPCYVPVRNKAIHQYGTEGDARWTCQTAECGFENLARKQTIENAATAAEVQSWSWDYEIPFNFEAPVQNDRYMNYDQCYTILLPYALELNDLKAYALEQHNLNIVGFKEQAVAELPALTPFLVKAEASGNPLNMPLTMVYMTLTKTDEADWMTAEEKDALLTYRNRVAVQPSIRETSPKLVMTGTLNYLAGDDARGYFIMQGKSAEHPNGVFKYIRNAGGYDQVDNRACILPMRAFLMFGGPTLVDPITIDPQHPLARQTYDIVFYGANGSTTTVKGLVIDEDAAPVIYDLQGRRVQNPRKGGLYIINGKKAVY